MSDRDVFIVDGDSGSSTTTTAAPAAAKPGFVKRSCGLCSKDWGPHRCGDPACHSMEFTDRYIEPVPLMTRIQEKLAPKTRAPRATADQLAAVRDLLAILEQFRAKLATTDELVATAVRAGIEELGPAHNVLHQCTYTTGDASMSNLLTLSLGLRALSGALPGAIPNLEDTK